MTFDYTPRVTDYGIVYEPLVSVVLTNPITGATLELLCLIDSGAEETLITAEAAHELGITVDAGQKRLYRGIGHNPIVGYAHRITMRLTHDLQRVEVACAFVPGLPHAGLLGQTGFFEHYRVVFEKYANRFSVTPASYTA